MNQLNEFSLPVVLVGLPGTGKSKVGQALAARLGVPHIDTDQMVEEAAGMTIADIFSSEGETQFRVRELAALRQVVSSPVVVSVGGGAVETPEIRELLANGTATVVHLRADMDLLLERVTRNNERPLLRENPEEALRRLAERRTPLFEEIETFSARSTNEPVCAVVQQIEDQLGLPTVIAVNGDDPYPVLVAAKTESYALKFRPTDVNTVVLVFPQVLQKYAEALGKRLSAGGVNVVDFVHPDGEAAKTLAVAEQGWALLGEHHVGRRDLIVTLGGGATTDLGGFLAATWLRGIRVIHFPTTLLAMVDAAVGGKTGINSPAGKNLIGSFHNPVLVAASLDYLKTLPRREYSAGLGEVVKCGFIADPQILRLVEENPQIEEPSWGLGEGRVILQELVTRAIQVKADVVSADFRESGRREILNYGHTLAHAIEKDSNYQVRHGEAVAIGSIFAAEIAAALGMLGPADVQRHRDVFAAVNLPSSYAGDAKRLIDLLYSDKKTRGNQLRFVLLDSVGSASTYPVSAELAMEVALSTNILQ